MVWAYQEETCRVSDAYLLRRLVAAHNDSNGNDQHHRHHRTKRCPGIYTWDGVNVVGTGEPQVDNRSQDWSVGCKSGGEQLRIEQVEVRYQNLTR